MDFNKQKCLELLVESKKVREQGKLLYECDPAKSMELAEYLNMLYDDVFWNSRYHYLEILENFINKTIDLELILEFNGLRASNFEASRMRKENLENEIDFQLNPESRGFTDTISSIFLNIDQFDPNVTLDMNLEYPESVHYSMSEEFLKFHLKKTYLPIIREYCKKS